MNNHPQNVMVIGTNERSPLIELLFRLGYYVCTRSDMLDALKKISTKKFSVVFLDQNYSEIDAFEFILNIRDVDQKTALVLAGKKQNSNITVMPWIKGNTEDVLKQFVEGKLSEPVTINNEQ